MSAKKSWDIRPNEKKVVRISPDLVIERRIKKSMPGAAPLPLKARRKKRRRVVLIVSGILFLILSGVALYGIWQPVFRVQHINASGVHAEEARALAEKSLTGTFGFVIPRDSIFFFPKSAVRSAILHMYPDISAVSVKRTGFESIAITTVPRTEAFIWCGTSIEAPTGDGICYEGDAMGYLFAPVYPTPVTASSTVAVIEESKRLSVYAPLMEATSPLTAHVANTTVIPYVLKLERGLASLGADVRRIQIRGDEADFYTVGNTRITYVLGDEENAGALAASSFQSLNLNDGSIEYVDLRFSGKVYFKRTGGTEPE